MCAFGYISYCVSYHVPSLSAHRCVYNIYAPLSSGACMVGPCEEDEYADGGEGGDECCHLNLILVLSPCPCIAMMSASLS